MCLVTNKKAGKQVNLGLFTVISPLLIQFYDRKFLGTFRRLKFIGPVRQFCEKDKSFMVIQSKAAKSRYFFPSHMSTFHLLLQLLLPTVKLNGVSQPISIEYTIVNDLIQAVYRT